MIQISPETQLFIREHSSDNVRALALQAKKYPDIDMQTSCRRKDSLMAGNGRDMVSETSVSGAMLF